MVPKYFLKGNTDKCDFLASSCEKMSLNVNNYNIEHSKTEKFLVVKFDSRLTLHDHLSDYAKRLVEKYMQGTNNTFY